MNAPIALFAYNRPAHLRQTIDALLKNELASESDLVVFSDAPKNSDARENVDEVRNYLHEIEGFKSVRIIERRENIGLAGSIIDGVQMLCHEYGKVIVLEDDMETSPGFLRFMNDALTLYEQSERVISIHGYVYPVEGPLPETFFLKGADCWGWATWARGWEIFEKDGRALLREIEARKLEKRFDFNGAYGYTRMLREQVAGKNSSWAVRWYASAFLKDKLTLYPGRSLVRNIGNDDSGTHSVSTDIFDTDVETNYVSVESIPIVEDEAALHEVEKFLRRTRGPILERLAKRIRSRLPI